jgi:glycine cleavage system transcriptional repressor
MNRIIITAIGVDKPGLVDKISFIISQNDGNIENSKMIKIDNQFAMIIDFSCIKNLDSIKADLDKIKELQITYKPVKDSDDSYKYFKKYLIKGADNQGIVNKVSSFFSNQDINIIEVNTFLESAPITGTPLFNMEIIINYNNSNNITDIDSKLISLCDNLNLDIKIL